MLDSPWVSIAVAGVDLAVGVLRRALSVVEEMTGRCCSLALAVRICCNSVLGLRVVRRGCLLM